MRKLMAAAALVAVMGVAAQAASAQTTGVKPFQFGPEVSFATNSYGPAVGARVLYSGLAETVKVPGLAAYASFDYFFPSSSWGSGVTFWEINANATYDVKLTGVTGFTPYVGAGLNYAHLSGNCAPLSCSWGYTGLNILGGGRFNLGQKLHAFAEARIELRSASAVALTAGLLF